MTLYSITKFPLTRQFLLTVPPLTNWGSHSIALGVNKASYLCEVAVALADVLDAGGLHQKCIVCG